MAGPDDTYSVPQTVSGSGNVPMIIIAPAPEPSVTRGVTGLFVPIFLAVFIVVAIYFFFGAWQAMAALERQKSVTRDAAGIDQFVEDIYRQNTDLCRNANERPILAMPNIEAQIANVRDAIETQCRNNRNPSRRGGAAVGLDCPSLSQRPRTEAPTGTNLSDFKASICRNYRFAAAPPPATKGAPMVSDADPHSPYVVAHQPSREGMLPAIARAIVSLTLLAVLLLAFGAALAGWFLRSQLQGQLADEIGKTRPQYQLVVEYRDQLEAMETALRAEGTQPVPPDMQALYARMMETRGARNAEWRESYDIQGEIDILLRDALELRMVNQRLRARAVDTRDPSQPRAPTPP